ncbi:YHYH protein [Oceanospirillum maris]|uniref:YHYH protein n=1 Tax=Oceanospirillum maris TaxID=64977 RepID=UPI00041FB736|nr:YHYH protein [Oceanospirillum maris]
MIELFIEKKLLQRTAICILLASLAACSGSRSDDSSDTSGNVDSSTDDGGLTSGEVDNGTDGDSTSPDEVDTATDGDDVDSPAPDDVVISPPDDSTSGVLCDYNDTTYNNQPSLTYTSTSTWTCTDSTRELSANGIPDHEVGTFPNPNNPNVISEQTVSASFTLEPTETSTPTELGGPRGSAGYVLNGVKIDASTAGSCDDSGSSCSLIDNSGNWNIEALGQTSFDFGTDQNNAHVQPDGAYHYHGMPEGFITKRGGNSATMTLIGWAADGFPIYARYGYSVADDTSSELKAITGSYQLVSSVSASRPSTTTYPMGTFQQDWEYIAGSGDLDECNGRVGVTPEFPNGIYHYYATDTYPYFQRCVKGEVTTSEELSPPPPSF